MKKQSALKWFVYYGIFKEKNGSREKKEFARDCERARSHSGRMAKKAQGEAEGQEEPIPIKVSVYFLILLANFRKKIVRQY